MRQYWQPNIDNWVLNENDANSSSTYSTGYAGIDSMAGGIPVKSEEEDEKYNKLEHPHKGISKLSELCKIIAEKIENLYDLSKIGKDSIKKGNQYDLILQIIRDPELIGMLETASNEIKKRSISSF